MRVDRRLCGSALFSFSPCPRRQACEHRVIISRRCVQTIRRIRRGDRLIDFCYIKKREDEYWTTHIRVPHPRHRNPSLFCIALTSRIAYRRIVDIVEAM